MINRNYIVSVLARFEGKAITRGYIPCQRGTWYGGNDPDRGAPLGASGVTIATGVDLGQQSLAGLRSMGISPSTLAVLEPYIGLKRQDALNKLKANPFTLTREQVDEIDHAVHDRYINKAAALFGPADFTKAPKEVQAIAVSLHYQFGTPRRHESPALEKAWNSMKQGSYKEAADYLRNEELWSVSHRTFMTRRRSEANILDKALA